MKIKAPFYGTSDFTKPGSWFLSGLMWRRYAGNVVAYFWPGFFNEGLVKSRGDMHSLWFGLIEREETRDANGYALKVTA